MKMEKKIRVTYPVVGGEYYHYKGGLYEVITLATHSETQEAMVVYKSKLFGSIYVRPLSMWFDEVKLHPDGIPFTRFKLIEKK